ncbi:MULTISPECIES: bacitracin resistance protein [unclassified Microbacterium]|uniref:bacitracin resistance protein n=1 Tax=unclassified Microbacterium TaxID=2609290 RepID=UPI00301A90CD
MSDTASPRRTPRALPTWVVVTVSVVFGLFYAYFVWNAVGFLVQAAGGAQPLNGHGWLVLLLAVLFPLLAFGIAFALGWRRSWWEFSLVLLAGLCVVAVFWLNILTYAAGPSGAAMLG